MSEKRSSVKVTIVGHADATGKDMSNLALSVGRAEVVRSMMRARGVDPTVLFVRGAGPLEPLSPGASEDELTQQVGKQAYPSFKEANIDLKVVCENP